MVSWRRAIGSMMGFVEGFVAAKETTAIDLESRATNRSGGGLFALPRLFK